MTVFTLQWMMDILQLRTTVSRHQTGHTLPSPYYCMYMYKPREVEGVGVCGDILVTPAISVKVIKKIAD